MWYNSQHDPFCRAFKYAGFDKPRWMAVNDGSALTGSEFLYNANRSRTIHLEFDALSGGAPSHYTRKRVYGLGSTLEANYENAAATGSPDWKLKKVRIYVPGPDGVVGTREWDVAPSPAPGGGAEKALVYHYDHLGSIDSITPFGSTTGQAIDATGKLGRFSEDAWGQRRDPLDWTGAPAGTTDDGGPDSLTPRGFTGHEMLDGLGLVHMNGRIYDPVLGRFLSADVLVQFENNLQSYNRFSYAQNNPLSFTDPSGWALTPALDAYGSQRAHPLHQFTPEQERAMGSGAAAAPFTFLVKTASSTAQLGLLSGPGGMPHPVGLVLASRLGAETDAYLADAQQALMKADGVDPKLAPLWSSANGLTEFGINAACFALPALGAERAAAGSVTALAGATASLETRTIAAAPKASLLTEVSAAEKTVVQDTTYLYQKLGAEGEHLKFGITKNPATRYTQEELAGGRLNIIAEGAKKDMLQLERNLHETLPIGPEEGQKFYIQKQVEKGLTPPPYDPFH